ncbi:MAG: PEP/pyruvate-binding domain-containing protein [Candidatus Desulfaltia sp.]|nr:PEP/pyruvate-binding domain-containing protein [Candidatus Desulfaltia sp.]
MFKKLKIFGNRLFRRSKTQNEEELSDIFRTKYSMFKELLASNSEVLNIISDIEEKMEGRQVFGMSYIRANSTRAVFHTNRMVKSLNALSNNRYALLYDILTKINEKIKEELGKKKEIAPAKPILFYTEVNKDMVDWVGGKNANLGEMCNRVNLPIPKGFAITTYAFEAFLSHNDLVDKIKKRQMGLDPNDQETVNSVSEEIEKLIIMSQVPPEVEKGILSAYDKIAEEIRQDGHDGSLPRVCMRSSAIGEDSEISYAGQYLTSLNVPPDKLVKTYQYIAASLYTPRAISYRLNKGMRDEDTAMSVACLQMIESIASGVMYSRHPFNILENNIIISAVWGLGPYAVDGVITPDTYTVSKDKDLNIIETRISNKPVQLVSNPDGGLIEISVPKDKQDKACLLPEHIRTLAGYAVKLETHFGCPQDMEWTLDGNGRLIMLQTRPLHLEKDSFKKSIPRLTGYNVLIENGSVAFPGVGFGPAFHIRSEEDLLNFPEGAVLVARHSTPKFGIVMKKAQAIITDSGSVLGHMASLTREFAVPSILGTQTAFTNIPEGIEITVDAYSGRVYEGRVKELLSIQMSRDTHMKGTPVYQTLRNVAELILPLHLLNPKSPDFTPQSCTSLHDIMRLVHEVSYTEMFQISDLISDKGEGAVKLDARIPIDLHIIDLEGGLTGVTRGVKKVTIDNISSLPLKALLKGMTHKELDWREPKPVHFKGLMSVMSRQMLAPPLNTGQRFGDRSYAIISDRYINFSSRVGYHYSVLDSYCSESITKNYITFSFKGGAADDVRKNRRARSIAVMLKGLDFSVNVKGDNVNSRYQKQELSLIEEKLELIGRLLLFTRQMDMLMRNEASVEEMAKAFLERNYNFHVS